MFWFPAGEKLNKKTKCWKLIVNESARRDDYKEFLLPPVGDEKLLASVGSGELLATAAVSAGWAAGVACEALR